MTYYIFSEPTEGFVTHTRASQALVENPLLLNWIGQSCEDMWPAATQAVGAMVKWPRSQAPNQAGFSMANNTTDPIFVEIAKDSSRAQRLGDAMRYFHTRPGLKISHVVNGYDWASVRQDGSSECTVVDVGGSQGQLSIELAQRYAFIRCVVQDLPGTIEHASPVPSGLQGRVRFMEHDFFQEQPVVGAEVYLLRWILHDWSDDYAVKILQALVPALRSGSKVILNEICMPAVGSVSLRKERSIRYESFSRCPLSRY